MSNRACPPSICPGIPRLGKCPKGWTTKTFNDILRVIERPADLDDDTKYQLVNAKRNRGGIVPRECLSGREIKTKDQYFVRTGDFLIANRQIIHGACGVVPSELDGALVSGEYTVLHPTKDLLLEWLNAFTHLQYFQLTCYHSSIGVDVEKMIFKVDWWLGHELNIPPIAEQQKIATILSTWDTAIDQTRTLLAAAQRRKRALAQQLLPGNKRVSGFACNWKRTALRHVAEVAYGRDWKAVADEGGPIPVLGTGGQIGSASRALATGPAIIVGRKGSIDQPQLVTGQFWAVDTTFILSPTAETDARWLYETLCHRGLAQYSEASGVPSLSRTTVEGLELVVPPHDEQRAIATVLATADTEIHSLEAKTAALERQKKGLMQRLLTGEVRVNP